MKSADFAFGKIERILFPLISAYIIFMFLAFTNLKSILNTIIPLNAPFKCISVLGGFLIVFWVALPYRLFGKGYGIVTALLAVSFCLLVGPWFGVINPYWFSAVGFISFLTLGILVEYANGGIANLACITINWMGIVLSGIVKFHLVDFAILGVVAFLSGYAGDVLAKSVINKLKSYK